MYLTDKGKKQRGSIIELARGKDIDFVENDSESGISRLSTVVCCMYCILDENTIFDDSQDSEKWSTLATLSSPDKEQRSPHFDTEEMAMDPVKNHKGKLTEQRKQFFWPSNANQPLIDDWCGSQWPASIESWGPSFEWQVGHRPQFERTAENDCRAANFDNMFLKIKGDFYSGIKCGELEMVKI